MKFLILTLVTAFSLASRALPLLNGGDHAGNGGDPNEIIFKDVATNIREWILSGNARALRLPSGVTYDAYVLSMNEVLSDYRITFTSQPILVGGSEKLCRNFIDFNLHRQIICNDRRFNEAYKNNVDDIYRLIHHEFAGLAGLEVNQGPVSDYFISNQISAFLQYERVKRLPVQPQVMNICDRGRLGEAIAKAVRSRCDAVSVTRLAQLTSLFLQGTQIEEIPPNAFVGLESLVSLDLGHNQIKELRAGSFRDLPKLEVLNLSHNKIETVPRGSFHGLDSLRKLSLAHNSIRELKQGAFSGNLLKVLDLAGNKLTSFPEVPWGLKDLNLASNLITRVNWLAAAESVNLDNNQIQTLPTAGEIRDGYKLMRLSLAGNKIKFIPAESFTDLKNLTSLNLTRNKISQVDSGNFKGLGNLETLDLSYNEIESLPIGSFYWLPRLLTLDLSWNKIKVVSAEAFNRGPYYLDHLILKNNP